METSDYYKVNVLMKTFKSYYVVWKPEINEKKKVMEAGLNRTM